MRRRKRGERSEKERWSEREGEVREEERGRQRRRR